MRWNETQLVTNKKNKIEVMKKKISTKNQVIALMLQRSEGITYTEVVKTILAVTNPTETYNWRYHRGYWATNLGDRGYMRSGGDGYLYKSGGKWFAKWYEGTERLEQRLADIMNLAMRKLERARFAYEYSQESMPWETRHAHYIQEIQDAKEICSDMIKRAINKFSPKTK